MEECFELGQLAYHEHDFYHTVSWVQLALDTHRKEAEKSKQKEMEKKLKYPIGEFEEHMTDFGPKYSKDRTNMLDFLAFSQYKVGLPPHHQPS